MHKLIIKLSFHIYILIQVDYSISIFWLDLNTWFQHHDSTWYWSYVRVQFKFLIQLIKQLKMMSKELNIEKILIFHLCIIFLHYLFDRKS